MPSATRTSTVISTNLPAPVPPRICRRRDRRSDRGECSGRAWHAVSGQLVRAGRGNDRAESRPASYRGLVRVSSQLRRMVNRARPGPEPDGALMTAVADVGRAGYRHEAVLYAGHDEFLATSLPFVRDGIAAGEPVLVVTGEEQLDL